MATFGEELSADLADAISLYEQTFTWKDTEYPCVINSAQHSLVTRKTFFAAARYPKWGDLITVAGKLRQVTRLNGSMLSTQSGQMVEEPPFTDDPSDPALVIEFDVLIKY